LTTTSACAFQFPYAFGNFQDFPSIFHFSFPPIVVKFHPSCFLIGFAADNGIGFSHDVEGGDGKKPQRQSRNPVKDQNHRFASPLGTCSVVAVDCGCGKVEWQIGRS
jgi:hypothetical protein